MIDITSIIKYFVETHFGEDAKYSIMPFAYEITKAGVTPLPSSGSIYTMYFLLNCDGDSGLRIESDTLSNSLSLKQTLEVSPEPYQGFVNLILKSYTKPISLNFIRVEVNG